MEYIQYLINYLAGHYKNVIPFFFVTVLVIVVFKFGKIIYSIIRNERKRKSYEANIKPGDNVYVPVNSNSFTGEVLEVNGDEVKIIVTATKSRVYQK
jgi:preprotein translocase subunit YajC